MRRLPFRRRRRRAGGNTNTITAGVEAEAPATAPTAQHQHHRRWSGDDGAGANAVDGSEQAVDAPPAPTGKSAFAGAGECISSNHRLGPSDPSLALLGSLDTVRKVLATASNLEHIAACSGVAASGLLRQ